MYCHCESHSNGGEKVFLKIDEDRDFRELVKESNLFFNKWLSMARAWETRDVTSTRYIWCRIYGASLHVWMKKVFSILTTYFGRFPKDITDLPLEREVEFLLI